MILIFAMRRKRRIGSNNVLFLLKISDNVRDDNDRGIGYLTLDCG